MDTIVRFTSPLPVTEVHRYIVMMATEPPLLAGELVVVQPSGWAGWWAQRQRSAWTPGMDVRVVAEDQVVLKLNAGLWQRLLGDTCEVHLRPADNGSDQVLPEPAGTLLTCRWLISPAKQVFLVLIGVAWVIFGVALAAGIFFARHTAVAARIFFLLFGGMNAAVGVLGIWAALRPPDREQRYVLAWLAQVTTAQRQ